MLELDIGSKTMNKIVRYFIFAGLMISLVSFIIPEKKLQKLIGKIWSDQEVEVHQLDLPDSLVKDLNQLYEVKANGEVIGYACFNTAFGCRVGGCAAPSNPNALSYETFDYYVIYDTDLKIKKVDIANYGGQYGYEICRAKWLKQFQGKTDGFALNDDIDGVSGATVSAQFLVDDLNAVGHTLKSIDLSSFSSLVSQ